MKTIIFAACLLTSTAVSAEQFSSDRAQSIHGKKTFLLTLIDGEQLSVFLPENELIHLSDGNDEWMIASENIQKIYNDGWLFGEYVNPDGVSRKFSYAFTDERNLNVYLADDHRSIELPWYKISSLCQLDISNYGDGRSRNHGQLIAEEKSPYDTFDQHNQRDVVATHSRSIESSNESTIGAYDTIDSSALGFEILLDPEDFFCERGSVKGFESVQKTIPDPKPILVGLEIGEIPKNISFTSIPESKSADLTQIALTPSLKKAQINQPLTSSVVENEPYLDEWSYPTEESIHEEEEEEEDIIFISQNLSLEDYESIPYATDDIPFEIFDNTWDDISADFFVYGFDDVDMSLIDDCEDTYQLPLISSHHLI